MDDKKYAQLSPCDYAGPLQRNSFMDAGITGLWENMPRISGPAFTVKMRPGDNLALHKAIYDAPKGSIIVAQTNSMDFAVAGGNVCAIAQQRGIAGFVIDGVVRDIGEIKQMKFALFARGVLPMPGVKKAVLPLNTPIIAGGVKVNPGDIIVADCEGVVVIPKNEAAAVYQQALSKAQAEQALGFDKWAEDHRKLIDDFYQ